MAKIRKTKIICTIGPATGDRKMLGELIRAGMDVARLNFSHGEPKVFGQWIQAIRGEAQAQSKTVAILQDLPGPKLRTGPVKAGEVILKDGARFLLRTEPDEGSEHSVQISYAKLPQEVSIGDPIFIDDGRIRLKVIRTSLAEIETEVIGGGLLRSGRGINVPQSALSMDSVTDRDLAYLDFGLTHGVDWVAVSFIRSSRDIETVRAHCMAAGKRPKLMAKIERREALVCLDEIVRACDGVMVARGDLGVEIPVEEVPMAQKRIISLANQLGKPVITATQMLETMVEQPWPTRAEVTDVANAVLDGTDAVMLSQETSVGKYPLKAVEIMDRVVREVENHVGSVHRTEGLEGSGEDVSEAVVHGACHMAGEVRAGMIATITRTGRTAQRLSAARPDIPIVAVVAEGEIGRWLVMHRGVIPLVVDRLEDLEGRSERIFEPLCAAKLAKAGDLIILTGGLPSGKSGSTSFVKVLTVT